ncbi:glycosyltransferase 87 family protein [Streptomyces coeruleorubidus]|uniref:Glycosyltransferase 87 family protein n=1 Tax=Streptomyces coeruleorubidus TaxID=116188 RepID=A0ABZ0KE88_STRC4|nr:glycosyltransferase 87 family protein [Streptomyces coeruleorubidus]WOT36077.1 glycosyltransferase 87 family protein [Streptomyces coeruleorubidus]
MALQFQSAPSAPAVPAPRALRHREGLRQTPRGARRDGLYWAGSAVFALALAAVTTLPAHRVWGVCAAVGYAGAAVLAGRTPYAWGRASAVAAVAGSVLLPLAVLMVLGTAQSEVGVVEHSGDLLLATGSPYAPHPSLVDDFNPYLPGMALLGVPHALLGDTPLTDARLWFAAVFLGALAVAARPGGGRVRGVWRRGAPSAARTAPADPVNPVLLLASCPAVALALAVGGVDLPVIGLMCLGLALAGRRGGAVGAGAAMGAAAALKWTAWPLLPVALVLLAVTAGRRAAVRAAVTALAVAAAGVVPFALVDPHAFAEHVVLFPLGAAGAGSPATSPLPGHLLATHVPGGRAIAVAALAGTAVGMAVWLLARPPRTVVAAADRAALGLALAMCLMPATRFGYLVYPLVLAAWFRRDRFLPSRGRFSVAHEPQL